MRECPDCEGFGMVQPDSPTAIFMECRSCHGIGFAVDVSNGQSRKRSMVEIVTSTAIGFAVSVVLTAIVMPAFGYPTTWVHDFWITAIFTVASLVRGYCVRRAFEAWR